MKRYKEKLDKVHCHAISLGGKCLSIEYISARVPMQWKCANGHIFENALCNIKAGSWCPKCLNKTEDQVRKIFEEIFNKKFESIRPDFLKNPETGHNLELDGYCEELKIAFEYDGEWHYIEHFASNIPLKKRKELDLLKSELCQLYGVTLYRVPFTAKSLLREFIYNLIKYHKMENYVVK